MTIRKILVPVDFSPSVDRIIKAAITLATATAAKIYLLHVEEDVFRIKQGHVCTVMDRDFIPIIDKFHQTVLSECTSKLKDLLSKIPENLRGDTLIREGHPMEQILDYIREQSIDLVVIGSRGQSKFASQRLGSTTEKIARKAPCSVYIVKDEQDI